MANQIEHVATSFLSGESFNVTNYEDWSYLAEFEIGTPPKKFKMGLSSVTTDSWVLGSNCWSLPCFYMPLYDSK